VGTKILFSFDVFVTVNGIRLWYVLIVICFGIRLKPTMMALRDACLHAIFILGKMTGKCASRCVNAVIIKRYRTMTLSADSAIWVVCFRFMIVDVDKWQILYIHVVWDKTYNYCYYNLQEHPKSSNIYMCALFRIGNIIFHDYAFVAPFTKKIQWLLLWCLCTFTKKKSNKKY